MHPLRAALLAKCLASLWGRDGNRFLMPSRARGGLDHLPVVPVSGLQVARVAAHCGLSGQMAIIFGAGNRARWWDDRARLAVLFSRG